MASTDRIIEIIFQGDDKVSSVIGGIESKLNGLDDVAQTVGDVTQPFANLATSILKVEAALAALAAGGLAYAYNKSIEFEGASADLQKVLGDNAEALSRAEDNAVELSNAYGVSATNVLASTANFKQAGYDIEESMALAKDSLDLVIAGEVSADEASKILTRTLKGFGEEADQATRLLDILNEVSNEYSTDVRELATGMARLSPVAESMGLSMEETAGLLTPVIEIFGSGSEAANGLRTGLLKLLDDAKPVTEALESIGVSQHNANGELRPGRDILYDVAEAFQEIDQNQKLFVASQLVGLEQAPKMVKVFDNLEQVLGITATAMDSAGSAAEEVATRLQTGEVQVERFKTGFANLATVIGDQFNVAATGVVSGATEIENSLYGIIEGGGLDDLSNAFESALDDIAETLGNVAENLPEAFEGLDFDDLIDSFENLGVSINDIFSALIGEDIDLNTVEGLEQVLQGIIDLFTGLNNVSSGILDTLPGIVGAISDFAGYLSEIDADTIETVGKVLGSLLVINIGAGFVSNLAGAAAGFAKLAGVSWSALSTGAAGAASSLGSLLAVGGAGYAGWEIGSIINDGINGVVKTFSDNQSLGGLIYDWTHGDDESAAAAEAELRERLADIPRRVEETSKEVAEVPFEIDKNGTMEQSAKEETDKVKIALAELKSEETIASLEFEAKIDIAQIEEQTKRIEAALELEGLQVEATTQRIEAMYDFNAEAVVAEADKITTAFDSMSESIGSISGLISGGIGEYTGAEGFWEQRNLKTWIEEALAQQGQLVDAQARLANTQSELAELKIERLASGEALIKIDSDGLEPALEQVLWSIMEKVQLRVAMEQSELLLGMGVEV